MSLSNNLETYQDVEKYLNMALANNGARFILTSAPAATRWRQRAYHYRKLVREANAYAPDVMARGKSPWEGFVIRAEGNIVTILREADPVMEAMTLDGAPIEQEEVNPTELLDQATGPAAKVGSPSLVEVHGFTEEQAARARAEVEALLKGE